MGLIAIPPDLHPVANQLPLASHFRACLRHLRQRFYNGRRRWLQGLVSGAQGGIRGSPRSADRIPCS
eukprot:2241190-Pyramimonas_sp.AAC.1